MYQIFGLVSGLLVLLGFVPYIKFIIQNRHTENEGKPVKITWMIWATNDTVILTGMYLTGSLNMQIGTGVICAWTMVILSLLYGNSGWKTVDVICGIGAVLGIILAVFYDNPTIAIVASNSVLILGGIPTFISTYEKPERENRLAWTLWFISCFFVFATITEWNLNNATQPITFFIIEAIQMVLLWIVPLFNRRKPKN